MPVAPVTFAYKRLERIAEGEGEGGHFWYAPRQRLLLDTIARDAHADDARFLDVGCGTGALVAALRERGWLASGLDPWAGHDGAASDGVQRGQAESIPWPDASFEAVGAFDVLEHADDEAALRELARVLVPGGRLFVSVPAYAWLWSARDTLAGHRRRYTRGMLRARVVAAGFVVERLFGYQCLLLPLLAASRLRSRHDAGGDTLAEDRPGAAVNAVLRAINDVEVGAGRWIRPPVGSSLVLVARKPGVPA